MKRNKILIGLLAILVIYLLFGCDRRVAPEETIIVDQARLALSRDDVNINEDDGGNSQGGEAGSVVVLVEVKDDQSVGIPGVEVTFIKDSEKVTLSPDGSVTDDYGILTATLKWFGEMNDDRRDTIEVRARIAGYEETLKDTVIFFSTLPGVPVDVLLFDDLGAEESFIPLDTTDYPIRVRALSELANPVPNLDIKFSASSGQIYPTATTDADGWAMTKYTPESTGIVKITAAVDEETGSTDSISIFKYFTIPSGDPALLEFQGGASVNLQITGTGGNADAPVSVDVLDASGTVVENYPYELKMKFEMTNFQDMGGAYFGDDSEQSFTFENVINGTATTTVHSGIKSGTIGTIVTLYYVDPETQETLPYPNETNPVFSSTNTITVSNGPPANIVVQVEEDGEQQDGQWRCFASANVTDTYGNAVPDSTAVLFSTSNPSASVNAFAFTYNENDNNNQNHGIAYTKLFYDSQHINDTVTIIAKSINNYGEQIIGTLQLKLPVQDPNIAVISSVEVLDFYCPMVQGQPVVDFDEFGHALLSISLIDGFENYVSGTPLHLNISQGFGKFNEQPFTGSNINQWIAFENQPDDVTGTDGPGLCSKYVSVRLGDVILQPDQPSWGTQDQVAVEISSPDFEGNEAQVQITVRIMPE